MAIIIQRQPPEIDFTGNDIYFKCLGNTYSNDISYSAKTTIKKLRTILPGTYLKFNFLGISIEIIFVTTPDDSGFQVKCDSNGTQIAAALRKNYNLNKYYIIAGDVRNIVFTSREKPGSVINVEYDIHGSFQLVSNIPGTDYIVRDKNYKIYSALYLQSGTDTYSQKNEMFTDVDSNGVSTILINGILNKLLEAHKPPSFFEHNPRISYTAKKYYIELAECYNKTIRQLSTSALRFAVPGKIPTLSHRNFNYTGWVDLHKCFLTNINYKIFTTYGAEQYLYFLAEKDRVNLYVQAKITYTTGETETKELFQIKKIFKGETVCIPTGIMHCGINRADKIISEYTILLKSNLNTAARAVNPNDNSIAFANFEVGRDPVDALYFLYLNELNAYETLIATKPKIEETTKRTQTEKFELDGFNQENLLDDSSTVYEAVTIPLTQSEQIHFREFLNSDNIYLKQNRRRYKVSLIAGSTETLNTNSVYQEIKFKYTLDVAGDLIDESRNYDDSTSRIASINDFIINVTPQIIVGREIVTPSTVTTLSTGGGTNNMALSIHERKVASYSKLGHVCSGKYIRVNEDGTMEPTAIFVGKDGKDAYEVWLEAGNAGTVEDFLEAMKGEDGENGNDGRSFLVLGTISQNIQPSEMPNYLPNSYTPNIGDGWLVGDESNLYYYGEYQNELEEWITGWIDYGSLIGLQGPPGASGENAICPEDCGNTINLPIAESLADEDTLTLWKLQKSEISFGFMYNFYAASDARNISSSHKDYEVPTGSDLVTLVDYAGGASVGGGHLKSTDTNEWYQPNIGASDTYGFSAVGSGRRSNQNFTSLKTAFFCWSKNQMGSTLSRSLYMNWNVANAYVTNSLKWWGLSIRLVRLATTEELLLPDGTILVDDYIGNDLRKYNGVKIGTQIWTKVNIAETKYANGDLVSEVTDIESWENLTSGALCAFDNNIDYVFDGIDENIPHKLTIEKLKEELGGVIGQNGVGIDNVVDNQDGTMTIVLTDESTHVIELPAGQQGLSAYEIWLQAGNEGTEQDYLDSLQGIDGQQGLSAYEIWLQAGNEGSVQDYLNSIKGEPGQPGASEPLKQLSSCTYEGELIKTAIYKYDNPQESTVEYRFEYADVFATKIECKNALHLTWKQTNIVWDNEKISSITHQNITEWTII